MQTLTGANTYAGPTAINAGTLRAGAANVFSNRSAVTVASGGTLDLNSYNQTIGSLAGAGSVALGSGSLTTGGDNTSTAFSGVIAGSGGLVKTGSGTLTLTGANTYTGVTAISGGTLALIGNGSILDSASVMLTGGTLDISGATSGVTFKQLAGNGGAINLGAQALTLDVDTDSTNTTAFAGSGTLTKTGAGLLILDGDSSAFTGTTEISQGSLEIGDINTPTARLGGDVLVDAAGTLRGHGAVLGSVTNNGTVAPGGSIGTLTINGNYTQASTATLSIEVSPAAASQLKVLGTANLGGGRLGIVYDPGTYSARSYTIVSAGSVNGTFGSVSSSGQANNGALVSSVSYDASNVYLTLTSADGNVVVAPSNVSIYSAMGTTALLGQQAASAALLDRAGAASGTGTPWATLTGTYTKVSGSGSAPGFISQRYGFLGGDDRRYGDTTVGISLGYDHANVSEQQTGASGTVDAVRAALYASRNVGPAVLSGTVGAGLDALSQKRGFGAIGTAKGDHLGQEINLGGKASLPLDMGDGFTLTPHAGLRYAYFHAERFDESGASGQDLHVGADNAQSLQPYVGVALGKDFGSDARPMHAELRAGYARELLDADRSLTVTAQDGTPFVAAGSGLPRSYPTAGLGVTLHPAKNLDIALRYDVLFNASRASAQQGSLNVAYRF